MPPLAAPHFIVDALHAGHVPEDFARSIYDLACVPNISQQSADSLNNISELQEVPLFWTILNSDCTLLPFCPLWKGVYTL